MSLPEFAQLIDFAIFAACLQYAAFAPISYALTVAVYNRYFHPYAGYPGPFWASITTLWYWRAVRFARAQDHGLALHEKYGKFVRISPDQIQISSPAAIDIIYGANNTFRKADFYNSFNPRISKRMTSFEEQDEKKHRIRRRIQAPLYTQASILRFEPCVDRVIALFYEKMGMFAESGQEIDMSTWLRKYTFDVVGEIFYGRKGGFGFIRDNVDYNNWCKLMETMVSPAAANTYIPWGFRNLAFVLEFVSPSTRVGAAGFFDVIKQSKAAVKQRLEERAAGKWEKGSMDLLNRLLDLVNDDPDPKVHWTTEDVAAEIWSVIWAGSDTTAVALTSIFYHLHKNPTTLAKLRAEIDHALFTGALTYPLRYSDAIKLPYLHAVVREAMRVHPSLGIGLPRIVPSGGATICDKYFPANYGVIMNQNAVHFDTTVFGSDSKEFIPERWIRDGKERADFMERHMLHFGYGPRICLGRHISQVEMYKLLPLILGEFEFEGLEREENVWSVYAGWFHLQKGVDVKVKKRSGAMGREGSVVIDMPEGRWKDE